jgi:hypothetical protein
VNKLQTLVQLRQAGRDHPGSDSFESPGHAPDLGLAVRHQKTDIAVNQLSVLDGVVHRAHFFWRVQDQTGEDLIVFVAYSPIRGAGAQVFDLDLVHGFLLVNSTAPDIFRGTVEWLCFRGHTLIQGWGTPPQKYAQLGHF